MTPERWSQIEGLFLKAIETPPDQRARLLDEACQGDQSLLREVNSLLANDNPSAPLMRDQAESTDLAGRRIGVYRLKSLLGQGGMGSVYLAVRDDAQFKMEVAVKLLKRGMDTDFMLSRFRQERQILANLEHPFIARLLDGGATEDGLPYFVLEYVDGLPITKYCAEKGLNLDERLRLFRLVSEAVQHAHQNLVVHRDLKPGNILITKEGIPKLLDFGIAKLIDPVGGSVPATLTRRDQRLMTPAYASPEQALGLAVNTATDIYSLGAVLYELLSGKRPHRFTTESPSEMEKIICEVEPEKPSLAAGNRKLEGDLDNIIFTAMRKEPQRRYASVAEFSEDIRRHMDGLPVAAQEDRWAYRAGKFVRRNRIGVAAALLVLASLVGGIIATVYQARRAERQFQLVRGLSNSMLFDFHDQLAQLTGSTALRATLVQTVVGYLDSLAKEGGGDADLDLEIAGAYQRVAGLEGHPFRPNLGQTADALNHYTKAIDIYERLAGLRQTRDRAMPGLIGSNIEAGDIEIRIGKVEAAMARLKKASAMAAEASGRDKAAVPPELWVTLYFRLGDAEGRLGAPEKSLPHFQKALEVAREWAAADKSVTTEDTLRAAYGRLANAQMASGNLEGARDTNQANLLAVEELQRHPAAPIATQYRLVAAHHALGDVLGNPDDLNLGDTAGALRHFLAAAEIAERLVAADPLDVRAKEDLQASYRRLGAIHLENRPAEALQYYRKAYAVNQLLREENRSNINTRRDLVSGQVAIGEALHRMGRHKDALVDLVPALESMEQILAEVPSQIFWQEALVRAHSDIAAVLLDLGDTQGALEHHLKEVETAEKLVKTVPSNLYFQRDRADAFESMGRYHARLQAGPTAGVWLQKSLGVWQDWIGRKVAAPFASRRKSRVDAALAGLEKNASSEKSVGHRYAPMGAGISVRAAREPDVG